MQTEARVGVVVEGGQRSLNTGNHGGGSPRTFTTSTSQPKQSLQQQPQIGTVSQLLAGGIAGAVSKTCTAPLARLTILFQVQGMHSDVATMTKPCIWREASRIVSEEGFRAFWRGNLVTIAHRLPYSSVSFYAYERYKHLVQSIPGLEGHRENVTADVCVRLLAGGLAGVTAASATYPLDLVRTRLAAQTNVIYYKGITHAIRTICREEGCFGLYKGLGATLLGVGPSIAISFSVYETLRSSWHLRRPQDSTVLVSLACGSLSGIASSTATFPLDLVRRRMQLEGAGGRARVYKTGLFGTFEHIMRSEGLRGLYRGILPEYYKVVPSVGIVFMTYEMMKILLSSPVD
ncbi:Mitochondrial carrier protein coac2 [Thalictrum thalictroides]|uniref:Mitochondrial carrier protein coac2 n=1 Tax=Thalictrum thalictroides TaxID=46969 RepID=A0A7J6V5H4_THATH|nr:Mitochondrial carrier protein coac2 [Thalictrum thalictroides]